jgi:hypothetical protein
MQRRLFDDDVSTTGTSIEAETNLLDDNLET